MATEQKKARRKRYRLRYAKKRKKSMEFNKGDAAKGAAVGATIDVALGGATLGLGSVIGGALGGFGAFEGAKGNRNDGTKWIDIGKYWKGGSRYGQVAVTEDTNPNWYNSYKAHIEIMSKGIPYENIMAQMLSMDAKTLKSVTDATANTGELSFYQKLMETQVFTATVDAGFFKPSPPATGNSGISGILSDIVGGAQSGAIAGAIGGALSNPTLGGKVNDVIKNQTKVSIGQWFANNLAVVALAVPFIIYGIYQIFKRK